MIPAMGRLGAAALVAVAATTLPGGSMRAHADERSVSPPVPEWATGPREMAPGVSRYTGRIRGQGVMTPVTLATTIRDDGATWTIEDHWTFGDNPMDETSSLEKGTLSLLRHTSHVGLMLRELEVRDGWILGWRNVPDSPDPRDEIVIEADHPIFAWGAGVPQVVATLPLARGHSKTIWNIELGADKIVSRVVEVAEFGAFRTDAGAFTAWKVRVGTPDPGGHALTIWIDARTRRVLRYDGRTQGPGPAWSVALVPD